MIKILFNSASTSRETKPLAASENSLSTARHHRSDQSHLWRFLMLVSVIFCLYAMPGLSLAETHQITLSAHEFEAWTFTPKPDDKIDITNHSDISHSIYISYPDGTVENLGVQTPGEKVSWTVPAAGEYILQCWIHPVIRASMTVANSASMS